LTARDRIAIKKDGCAHVTLAYTKVIAPLEGTVVAIVSPEGQTVNAVQAAPTIVKLANLTVMTVKAQISEADVTRVHAGQRVYFTILGNPDHRYQATLRAVEPAPESIATETSSSSAPTSSVSGSAVYYNGLFDVENPGQELRISMTAQVNIVLAEAKNALAIPSAALVAIPGAGGFAVTVVSPSGIRTRRTVNIGINNSVITQILNGLSASDRVLLEDTPK
jgi:membrane fusion protein, macrolide-specific efflux system